MDLRTALKAVSAAVVTKASGIEADDTLTEAIKKVLIAKPAGASIEDILVEMVNPRYDYKAIALALRTREAEGLVISKVQPGTMLRMKYLWKTAQKETVTNETNDEIEGIIEMNVKEEAILRLQEIYTNGRKFCVADVTALLKDEFADELRRLRKSATAMAGEVVTKISQSPSSKATGKGDKCHFSFILTKPPKAKEEGEETTPQPAASPVTETVTQPPLEELTKLAIHYKGLPNLSLRTRCWSYVVLAGGDCFRGDILTGLEAEGLESSVVSKAFSNAVTCGYIRVSSRDGTKIELDIVSLGSVVPPPPRGYKVPAEVAVGAVASVPQEVAPAVTETVSPKDDPAPPPARRIPLRFTVEPEEDSATESVVNEVVVSKEITARLNYHGTEVTINGMSADVAKAIREMMK